MRLIDTHCHLYLEEFDADRNLLISDAIASGIDTVLLPNIDLSSIDSMHALCDEHPGFAYPMMGLHPTSVGADYVTVLKQIETHLSAGSYCAIGEIGIDLYWDKTYLKEQKEAFKEQLRWSIDLNLPVAIHTRDAFPEVLDCIHTVGKDKLRGVFHSFSGTETDLTDVLALKNFKLGINGVVTFKNATLSAVLSRASINDIVLETDAPYLAPVPFRGKRNLPVYIWMTARKVAEIVGLPLEETVEITRRNALNLFEMVNKHIE